MAASSMIKPLLIDAWDCQRCRQSHHYLFEYVVPKTNPHFNGYQFIYKSTDTRVKYIF